MNEITIQTIDQLLISHRSTCKQADRTLHIHSNAYELMLFKSGNVDYFINDAAYHLKPGDVTFICPNDIHGFFVKDETPYERIPIHIEETFAASLCTSKTNLFACFHKLSKDGLYHLNQEQMEQYETLTNIIRSCFSENCFGNDIKVKACLSLILLLVNSALPPDQISTSDISPKIIRDAIRYINDNLTSDITIQVIADSLNISRSRLSHLFKDFTGTSLWNYIIARRIQHARTLLRQGASITTACYDCGFKDYAHFVKVFSRINGISPGKYIKIMKPLQHSPENYDLQL